MKDLIILQTCIPDYRKKLFTFLNEKYGEDFTLYGGADYFESTVKTDNSINFLNRVKNIYLFKRKGLFQTGMWRDILKARVVVLELNPRIISNWIILILRILLGKKTVLWGHAWPKNGERSLTDVIRGGMRQLGSQILVYTVSQKRELQIKMPHKNITCAPNAVFYKKEMVNNSDNDLIQNIIYVGRLTESKKPLFLVKAFNKVLGFLPTEAKLIIVGEGEEKQNLLNYINDNNLEGRVLVKGHIGSYEKLKSLYDTSLLSVSPGYIGLSVTQSFGFGVPMIVSKFEKHSPEIEAVKEGNNSVYFETDNVDSLADKILDFYNNRGYWLKQREQILDFCKENYSIEVMAEAFVSLNPKKI
ncbi:glycosyltransferase family 4 protein [Mangrovimonas sp. YM274]|uniref:glycosyltransferase family 4 protein n=1 Tax=Mangrovimonas sp. YM274 TaxID=3070660 RepID=UPI0027DE898D|nr:glycosyltransferase [Mangrovimonas sp. YM274]WMI68926.1 glycosyltransferase [Mangrovimonas sp. YM274]